MITAIIWGITAVTVFYCGIKVQLVYLRTKNRSVGDFAKFLLMGGGGVIIAVASYFIGGYPWLEKGFVIGVFVKLTGMAFLYRLLCSFVLPKFEKLVFWLVIAVNCLFLVVNTYYAAQPFPGYNPQTGQFPINFPVGVGILSILLVLMPAYVIPVIMLFRKAFKSKDKTVRLRGFLIGFASLFYLASISTCGLATRVIPLYFNNLLIALTALFTFVGIVYINHIAKPEAILPPTVSSTPPYTAISVNW